MKKFFSLIAFLILSFACNQYELPDSEGLVANEGEDVPVFGSFEEAQQAGINVVEPGAELCAGRLGPNSYCFIPVNLNVSYRNFNTSETGSIWFDGLNTELTSGIARINAIGWNASVTNTSSYNWFTVIGTTHPTIPNRAAETVYWVQAYVQSSQGGFYALHWACRSTLYKTQITNGAGYAALTDARKALYVQKIYDHEFSHCTGIPHNSITGSLMSGTFDGYPTTNLDPLPTEIQLLDNYNP